jgi:hypothetical protein
MSASIQFKGLLAGLAAVAIAGSAIAQGTPPNPAVKDPAVGAGQQSSQTTPMGSTGTPAGGSTAAGTGGSTSGSTTAGSSTGSSTTMGASGAASTDTGASTTSSSRTARADRN